MKPFMITIPEPCYENWNTMTPVEKGRYCSSCATAVMDFSVMTDEQIQSYLSKAGVNVCGHFAVSQVNRSIETPATKGGLFKHLWKLLLPGFFFAPKAFAQKTTAQDLKDKHPLIRTNPKPMILGKVAMHLIPKEKEDSKTDTLITTSYRVKETYAVLNDDVKVAADTAACSLSFGEIEKGEYNAIISGMDGKTVQQSVFYVPDTNYQFLLDLNKNITAGGYLLRITNKAGKLFYNGKIVVE